MKTAAVAGDVLGVLCVAWTFVMGFTGWYLDPVMLNLFYVVIGIEVAVGILERLARERPPGLRLVAVPIVNVDGVDEVDRLRAERGRTRFVRGNARRVDLNRNWPTHARGWSLWDPVLALAP